MKIRSMIEQPPTWDEIKTALFDPQAECIRLSGLPVHDSITCPQCGHKGVTLRQTHADCHACDYEWIYPYPTQVMDR